MSPTKPDVEDYLQLFRQYGGDLGELYREPEDERYALLFEQVVRLLVQPSPFNLGLPDTFRVAARRYRDGHPSTVARLRQPANRHFMLCELHDLIMLKGGLAALRKADAGTAGSGHA
ncbi:MAG: hypothetical protein LJE69_15730 [Thiohalocapsa sp.]|uniref:hypothetical protein n=1 Tax=Thiohalocapsa sp. TaxID=2497641 RepID=UPI0025F0D1C3|nr:hypothetical protein [Thiohalocapsa sp.]MCG6942690.1 hypothetical protein [Thiohalocapsa sp.]